MTRGIFLQFLYFLFLIFTSSKLHGGLIRDSIENMNPNFCFYCRTSHLEDPQICEKCKFIRFCSPRCKSADMVRKYHEKKCYNVKIFAIEIETLQEIKNHVVKILEIEDREYDFRNFCQAIAAETTGYLNVFNQSYPDIMDKFFVYLVGKKRQQFLYEVDMLRIYKYNLRVWVASSAYMQTFFQFENCSVSYPTKVMGIYGVNLGSKFEKLGFERKFLEFWNYFHNLFQEKPKARSIIAGIIWMQKNAAENVENNLFYSHFNS